MKRVNIVFTSLLKFWDFKQLLRRRPLQIHFFRKVIICDCTEAEISLAQNAYEAKVEEIR
jgi:hypothetical protein